MKNVPLRFFPESQTVQQPVMMHTQLMKYGFLWIILFVVFTFNGFLGAQELKILALGDSLTEGYGVEKEEAYPHLLEEALGKKDFLGSK